ncbi:MAG TPA: YqeG family HAD IIIA-type phosphatase [Firmicutes bacterium]|nr:YqeG family HAD IIIA-type phosphatase [Bacillota bacterium]
MLSKLCPHSRTETVASLSPEFFISRGIRGLIIDLDNTLVAWGKYKITREMRAWVQTMLASGLKICILSNAVEHRVRFFGELLDIPWISRATKPRKNSFKRAMEILQTIPEETAVIGDQLFTDIFGGNRMALYTIWTAPISPQELISTKAMRYLERLVQKSFRNKEIFE